MNSFFRLAVFGLTALSFLALVLCGCQQKEQAVPPPDSRSESQLDMEYRSLLAETGLYRGGTPAPPAQIEPGQYGQVLAVAAGHASTELFIRLLSARSDISISDRIDGRTLLHYAAATLHATNTNLLLERGFDPNVQDSHGQTALHLAVPRPDGVNLARLLLARGARPEVTDVKGITALMSADAACVRLLIDKGADVKTQDASGNSALHWAVYRKAYETAIQLILLGIPVDIQNSAGKTALHHAAELKDPRMAELLIKSGASADISDINGITPRQAAEKTGNKLLMGLFTQSVNSDKGNTPR